MENLTDQQKQIVEWLAQNTVLIPNRISESGSKMYVSKIDRSYVAMEGLEFNKEILECFVHRGISKVQNADGISEHTANIGWCEKERAWYGWSHRATFGFKIGHTVEPNHTGFTPSNEQEFITAQHEWFNDGYIQNVTSTIQVRNGKRILAVTITYDSSVPNVSLRNTTRTEKIPFPKEYGRGEWTAQTLDDAKQMAKDFAEAVS